MGSIFLGLFAGLFNPLFYAAYLMAHIVNKPKEVCFEINYG
jgi:hypothetical protein